MYLLHGFYTQNTLKTLYVLEELDVDFEFRFVNLMKGENRTDEFLNMTPIGKVPVLEHEGSYLFESGAICRYAANREQSTLYPADPMERAQVDQWIDFFSCHLGRWLSTMFFERIIKPAAGLGETDAAAVEEAVKFANRQLGILDNRFESTQWLANDSLSIADLFALAYIEQVRTVDFALDDYPRVQDWFERLDSRDSATRARALVQPYMQASTA
jgi:glutathione S-transferase